MPAIQQAGKPCATVQCRLNFWEFVAFAARAGQQSVGGFVTDEMLVLWIPMKSALDHAADVDEVAKSGGSVASLDIGIGLLVSADRLEEVLDVRNRFLWSLGRYWRRARAQFLGIGSVIAAEDLNPALVANEYCAEVFQVTVLAF